MITCIYNPPRKQNIVNFERLENYLDTLPIDPEDKHMLCEDFNINFLVNSTNFRKINTLMAGKNLQLKTLNQHWMRFSQTLCLLSTLEIPAIQTIIQ